MEPTTSIEINSNSNNSISGVVVGNNIMADEGDVTQFRDYSLDDSLYSRQRYVLGDLAMSRLAKGGNVLLSGLGGLGVEIAKNLVLAGLKSITIHDDQVINPVVDLSTHFFADPVNDIGKNRVDVSYDKLSQLNPYVKVYKSFIPFQSILDDLQYLLQFKCIIITECKVNESLIRINEYCRQNNIYFITADSFGLFGWVFNDFGNDFQVFDKDGEETKECFISNISSEKEAIVTCMENNMHQLESGDWITFREVQGMSEINGTKHQVKIINPYSFSIGDTTSFTPYTSGGIISTIKTTVYLNFKSLKESITNPDYLEFDMLKDHRQFHLARSTIYKHMETFNSLPKPWNCQDSSQFLNLANQLNYGSESEITIDKELFEKISFTSAGSICSLTSALGAFTAQECLKSLTGKFTPLKQWLYIDCFELFPQDERHQMIQYYQELQNPPQPLLSKSSSEILLPLRSLRSAGQQICIGNNACNRLENSKIFMIGSGAIGCEMLKNYALLGVGCGNNGKITITDNDLIEKSNLNRQFLFRNSDINQSKSIIAKKSIEQMNSFINIEAHINKVESASENIYNVDFYESLDCVVSALDNIAARVYVDSQCVRYKKPLLESGTLGTKGHTQVILPNLTESYATQKDPNEKQTPFCTLKSFPSNLDHCIQWTRDKFEKFFSINISELDKFLNESDYVEKLLNSNSTNKIAICKSLSKLISTYPKSFRDCLQYSRVRFEKLFNHNPQQLLKNYPLDLKTKEGVLFWTLPKRPPTPIQFDVNDQIHFNFLKETSLIWATIFNIDTPQNLSMEYIKNVLKTIKVPPFIPKNKVIISDEKAAAPVETFSYEQFMELTMKLKNQLVELKNNDWYHLKYQDKDATSTLVVQQFEKDDDSNHHIDFMTATANLRARIYAIEESDRFKVKLVAGKIIPAIATTTSVVSGLVSVELVKIVGHRLKSIEVYKNSFLNLSLPYFSLCEPGVAPKIKVTSKFYKTLWDIWEIKNPDLSIQNFINFFTSNYELQVSGIYQDSSLIYMKALPFHTKRLDTLLKEHLKDTEGSKFVDLFVLFLDNGEEVNGPPVRFYL